MAEALDDAVLLVFLPPGQPGRLDERRVYCRYPDGCETAFPAGRAVSVSEALANHRQLHEQGEA